MTGEHQLVNDAVWSLVDWKINLGQHTALHAPVVRGGEQHFLEWHSGNIHQLLQWPTLTNVSTALFLACQPLPVAVCRFLAKDLGSINCSSYLTWTSSSALSSKFIKMLTSTGRVCPLFKEWSLVHQNTPWRALLLCRGSTTLLSSASLVPHQTLLSIADV